MEASSEQEKKETAEERTIRLTTEAARNGIEELNRRFVKRGVIV